MSTKAQAGADQDMHATHPALAGRRLCHWVEHQHVRLMGTKLHVSCSGGESANGGGESADVEQHMWR
jgi:hypothetical protein